MTFQERLESNIVCNSQDSACTYDCAVLSISLVPPVYAYVDCVCGGSGRILRRPRICLTATGCKACPTIDDVEFYVGCQVQPGSMHKHIFSFGGQLCDALRCHGHELCAQDRFHTANFTVAVYPGSYTNAHSTCVQYFLKRHTSLPVAEIDVTTVYSLCCTMQVLSSNIDI
eukprot:m.69285 g.69285  ORF g.69285 m.69285 type:complete len:171 (+) comp16023_c0_seq9:1171-1683(+)